MKLITCHVLFFVSTYLLLSVGANMETKISDNIVDNYSSFFETNFLHYWRRKRDDGAFMTNSGGPLASKSKPIVRPRKIGYRSEFQTMPAACKQHKGKNETLLEKLEQIAPKAFDKNGKVKKKQAIVEFKKFMVKYNKTYVSKEDLGKAVKFFQDNFQSLVKMAETRRTDDDANFIVTQYTDMTFDLFKSQHTGVMSQIEDVMKADTISLTGNKNSCPKLNWNTLNVIPPVRQQNKCGSCYAMTTADLIAAQYSIDNKMWNQNYRLSAQYMIDCVPSPATNHCNGGRPVKIFDYLSTCDTCKVPTESCYQYADEAGTCKSASCSDAPPIKVKWGKMVDVSGPNEKELIASLLQYGPVIAIVGITPAWQMYDGQGILRSYQCSSDANHAVLITGYDYTGCIPHYIVKNTWGTKWGNQGYIKLEAGANTCGIAKLIVLVCTAKDCPDKDYLKYITSKSNYPSCQ